MMFYRFDENIVCTWWNMYGYIYSEGWNKISNKKLILIFSFLTENNFERSNSSFLLHWQFDRVEVISGVGF